MILHLYNTFFFLASQKFRVCQTTSHSLNHSKRLRRLLSQKRPRQLLSENGLANSFHKTASPISSASASGDVISSGSLLFQRYCLADAISEAHVSGVWLTYKILGSQVSTSFVNAQVCCSFLLASPPPTPYCPSSLLIS